MKKTSLIILIAIIASLMFSACTMSASTPPPVTPTTNLSEIARQATETAIAKTPKAGNTQVPEETEVTEAALTETAAAVVEPTSTPAPTQEEGSTDVVTEYPVPDSYTLHSGEFIFCLARRFNILPEDIMDYNGYEYGTLLFPGDTILLPPNGRGYLGDRALQYHPADYTVIYGDTLYSIACLYGDVDPRSIAAANDLDIDQVLTPGTVLQIP
ncbi:MAG TPA: LysM peptidoglycan-binding domain-containing protein [Chloroflexi bacterium]|nr:LysM peptidoglycan-binding domain-containing protein [Chloroflexota bacterium]